MRIRIRTWVLIVWLQSLGAVRGQDCTLQAFLDGPLFDQYFDTSALQPSYASGRQVRVSCSIGYSGFFKLICVGGEWQKRGDKCEPKSCGHPGEAQFADFHLEQGDDFVFGSKVVYTCHRGYQMVTRANSRRCMSSGWDGVVPVCEAQLCPVIHPDNTVVAIGDLEEANFGNVVRFRCKSNSQILKGAIEIYCNEDGEWSSQPPRCEDVKCQVPEIKNGVVTVEIRDYKEQEILQFRCLNGYKRIEERPSKCTKTGRGAEWVPAPECDEVKCLLPLTPLEGTSYDPAHVTRFSPGTSVTVQCGEAHWIGSPNQRSAVLACLENGEWSSGETVCKEVTCRNWRDKNVYWWNVGWGETKRLGETATYRCKQGHRSTNSASEMTCTRDGWIPNPPCEEIVCDSREFSTAENTDNKQKYKIGERASYICKGDYEGRFSLTCTERGWEGRDLCKEKQCRRLDITDAYILDHERDHYPHGQQVRYRCRTFGEREFTISCQRGQWSGVQRCSGCPPAEVTNGFVIGPFQDKLYFACNEGYKLPTRGWWGEATCVEGAWSGLEGCIDRRECGEAPAIPNAQEVVPRRDVNGKLHLEITCKDGFQKRINVLTCNDGKWRSNTQQLKNICTPVGNHCPPPPQVANAVVTASFHKQFHSNATVTYQCRHKFTLEGRDTIQCSNGSWESTDVRCTVYCFKPRDEQQTMIFADDKERYTEGEEISYDCAEPGPRAGGNATCVGGEWSEEVGCEVCSVLPDVPHAFVSEKTRRDEYGQGHVIHFTCETGYVSGPTIRYICSNGGWVALFKGSCTLKPCPLPEDIPNGNYRIISGDDLVFGAKVKYFCDEGYQVVGREDTRTCMLDHWTNRAPVCEPVRCEPPPIGGDVTVRGLPDDGESVLHDRFLTFSCDAPGQRLNGSAKLVCGTDGRWNHPFPTCQDITCDVGELHPQLIVHGLDPDQANMAIGQRLYFHCQGDEFALEGARDVACLRTGMWSEPIPTCAEKCRVQSVDGGVRLNLHTPGTLVDKGVKVPLSCRLRNQVLYGSGEVECLGDGQWSSPFPTCGPPRDCQKAPPLPGGDTIRSTRLRYPHGAQVEYVCSRYYVMEGGPFKTCQNAEWIGDIRCLKPCTVDRDLMNQYHITFRHSRYDKIYSEHDDVIEFTCARGKRPSSNTPMRQTCIDGQITLPSCQ